MLYTKLGRYGGYEIMTIYPLFVIEALASEFNFSHTDSVLNHEH